MWKLATCLLMVGISSPMLGAGDATRSNILNQDTVAEVEQVLVSTSGKKDAEIARQLYSRELTERFSTVRLSRWQAQLPGRKSRQAYWRWPIDRHF